MKIHSLLFFFDFCQGEKEENTILIQVFLTQPVRGKFETWNCSQIKGPSVTSYQPPYCKTSSLGDDPVDLIPVSRVILFKNKQTNK